MSDLDNVVDVSTSVREASVKRTAFGVPLIPGYHTHWTERIRTYGRPSELIDDGFDEDDAIYRCAVALCRMSPRVKTFKVGRLAATPQAQVLTLTPVVTDQGDFTVTINGIETISTPALTITPTAVNTTLYTVTIDGTAYSDTSDGSATATEIVTLLKTVVNAATSTHHITATGTATLILTVAPGYTPVVTVGANLAIAANVAAEVVTAAIAAIQASAQSAVYAETGSNTLVLTAVTLGDYPEVTHSANWTLQDTTPSPTYATDLAAISAVDDDWYAAAFLGTGKPEIHAAAAAIETLKKIALCVTDDADVLGSGSSDVASTEKALGYTRTALIYTSNPGTYPNGTLIGSCLSKPPGSVDWSYKKLTGTTADRFTTSERTNLVAKNVVFYTTLGAQPVTQNAKMIGGRYIDIQVGLDFTDATIQEEIFLVLSQYDKVGFTDKGIALIAGAVRVALKKAEDNGILVENSWSVTVPELSETEATDREDRVLTPVEWTAQLQGAINTVTVRGEVTF